MGIAVWPQALIQDVKFGLRQLVHHAGTTLGVALSLAIGLGGSIAVFSLLDALLFKSLAVPEPQRLIVVTHGADGDHGPSFPYPVFAALREQTRGAVNLFAFAAWHAHI